MAAADGAVGPGVTLEAIDLTYAYRDRPPALMEISLRVEAGGYLALVGQNGAGKTTLAKHFNGLLRPMTGRILVGGSDASDLSIGELAQHVGFVFQNPDHQIFAGTTRDEIAFGPRNLGLGDQDVQARVVESLEAFGLSEQADVPPAALGYGTRRKVALASVFAMRPQALILDEPTTGLDRRSVVDLMARLAQYVEAGRTVVVITHDVRLVADHVPRCAVLQAGRLLVEGDTQTVLRQAKLMSAADLRLPPVGRLARRLSMDEAHLPLDVAGFGQAYATLRATRKAGA
jgi:energy-coupling factor transport system ATP-binding protein